MSFIDTNTIFDEDFIDDKDDYKVEDLESLSAAFYFVEKLNPDWQDQLLGRLLRDWVDSDDSNNSDDDIDVSCLPVKPVHHHNTNNIRGLGATSFHYASLSAYFFFDIQSEANYQAKGSSSPSIQIPTRNWIDSGEIAFNKADTNPRPGIEKSVLDWKIIKQVRIKELHKILRKKVAFICWAITWQTGMILKP